MTSQADLRTVVGAALVQHRIDSMSQDSGQQCICGSDSRYVQHNGMDPKWNTIGDHLADVALNIVLGGRGAEDPDTVSKFDDFGGYYSVRFSGIEFARFAPSMRWSDYATEMSEKYDDFSFFFVVTDGG